MSEILEIKEELKKEWGLYFEENKTDLYGFSFGLLFLLLCFGAILLFVLYTKVMCSLLLIIMGMIVIIFNELSIRDDRGSDSYHKYHLLKEIKYFCKRLFIYPCALTFIVFLIWLMFNE